MPICNASSLLPLGTAPQDKSNSAICTASSEIDKLGISATLSIRSFAAVISHRLISSSTRIDMRSSNLWL